ncbi:phosphoserine phosphatase SerB [Ningiella sp. W23]|uniref:phosphoserine phosphatase SerB n=1 Tax=Ningiella sp. W23 TaxID=3023715 RepID=UPI003756F91C
MLYAHTIANTSLCQQRDIAKDTDAFDSNAVLLTCLSNGAEVFVDVLANEDKWLLPVSLGSAASCTVIQAAAPNINTDNLSAVLSLAGESISFGAISQILRALFGNETLFMLKLNPLCEKFGNTAVDVWADAKTLVSINPHIRAQLSQEHRIDIIRKANAKLHEPGLLVMDMDSTVIAMECIDEIAGLAGVKEQVSAVTERAMRGEIPFTQSLHDRVACLEGVKASDLLTIRKRIPYMPGFIKSMLILKAFGWRLIIASGGFTFFANYVKQSADLDDAFSNDLEIVDGTLTGKVKGKVVDGQEKANILLHCKQKFKISEMQTVAIGDGANDLMMMAKAGTSVAFRAKATVEEKADSAIFHCGFEGLLYALN